MTNIHVSIFLSAVTLAALPIVSQADSNQEGFFVNAEIGSSKVNALPGKNYTSGSFDDSGTAYDLNMGYRWGWFGVEAGYVDAGKFQITQTIHEPSFPVESFDLHARLHGFNAGVNAHYDFLPNWYVSGRAGAFLWRGDEENYSGFHNISNGAPIVVNRSGSKTDWYAGAGIGYDFSPHFGVGINYDHYKAKSDSDYMNLTNRIWSANAEYRF